MELKAAHAYDARILEAEARGLPKVQGQLEVYNDIQSQNPKPNQTKQANKKASKQVSKQNPKRSVSKEWSTMAQEFYIYIYIYIYVTSSILYHISSCASCMNL